MLPELLDIDENPPKTRVIRISRQSDRVGGARWDYVQAAVVPDLPDWLAVTMPPRDEFETPHMLPTKWRVTQIPAGLAVITDLRKADAILAAHALAREAPVLKDVTEQITVWDQEPWATARAVVLNLRDLLKDKRASLRKRDVPQLVQLLRHGLLTRKELMNLPAATQVAIDDALEQTPALENPPRGGRRPYAVQLWSVANSLIAAGLRRVGGGARNTYYGLPGQTVGVGYFIKLSPKKLQYVERVRGQYGKKLEDVQLDAMFYGQIRPDMVYEENGGTSDKLGQIVRHALESWADRTVSLRAFDKQAQALLNEWRKRARVWDGSELEDLAVHYKSVKRGYGVQETFDKALLLAAQGTLDPRRLETYYAVENVLEDMVRL